MYVAFLCVMAVLALVSLVGVWAMHALTGENHGDDQLTWIPYFGWCTFFQGTAFAFIVSLVLVVIFL